MSKDVNIVPCRVFSLPPLLCPTYLSRSLLQPVPTTDVFTGSMALPFPECHVVGIVHYVAFSDELFSLSAIYLRFLHVFDSPFIFSDK